MSIKRKVRVPKTSAIPPGQVASDQANTRVQVTQDNAPLLTVKFMEMILVELKKITVKLEKD